MLFCHCVNNVKKTFLKYKLHTAVLNHLYISFESLLPSLLPHPGFHPRQRGSWLLPGSWRAAGSWRKSGSWRRNSPAPVCFVTRMFRGSPASPCHEPGEAGRVLTRGSSGAWFWLIPGWNATGLGPHPEAEEPAEDRAGWPVGSSPVRKLQSRTGELRDGETKIHPNN